MDWAELNPDLLHLVVKRLGNISNFIRFRAVCKRWRLAAPTSDPPPQLPWFLSRRARNDIEEDSYHRIYSLYSNKTQKIHLPKECHNTIWFGSSCQYVHMIDYADIKVSYPTINYKLLDPLTGSQIPMLLTAPEVSIPLMDKVVNLTQHYIGPSHNPDPDCTSNNTGEAITMLLQWDSTEPSHVALLSLDDRNKTTTSQPKHVLQQKIVIYEHDNLITNLLDVTTRGMVVCQQRVKFSYLLEVCGDVFGVVKHFKLIDMLKRPMDKILFEVYRLENYDKAPHWAKMNHIGDRMLFLEYFSDCGVGFGLSASHFAGFKGNCIYFHEMSNVHFPGIILGRFDIEKGTTEIMPVHFPGVWFVPRL